VSIVVTNTDGQSGTLANGFTYAPPLPVPQFGHVFVVVEENQSYESVVGSSLMPYLNNLANRYGLATNYYANTNPSIGNYFSLTTGQVVTNDSNFNGVVTADNIVRQVLIKGKTWKSYAESLPSVGYTGGDQYPYVKRHNPFAYFSDVVNSPVQTNNLVPFSQFAADLSNSQLPHLSFIIPNQFNNAHDCPQSLPSCTNGDKLAAADSWLRNNIDSLIASPVFRQDGLLVIVFDESVDTDTARGGGHVLTLVISPKSKQSYQSTALYQHESALRMIAEGLGLSGYPGASATALNMAEFFGTVPNTAPIVGGVSPASGPIQGGSSVTISGTGFASGATVTFGGTAAASVNVAGSTSINAIVPSHPSGTVDVVVTNPDGQSGTRTNGYVYVGPPPTITGITPNSGTTNGGTSVTIDGNRFLPGAAVTIGGAAATNIAVANSTTITASTPAHAPGTSNVVVTNTDGQSAVLTNGFTYTSPPVTETILLVDDFNDNSLDATKWTANDLFSGYTDTSVLVTESNQLFQIGPLKQNATDSHYNGIRSSRSYDLTGGYVYVQIVQAPNSSTSADAFFTIGLNVNSCYRIYVEAGTLFVQKKIGGAKTTLFTSAFSASNHAFWRMRHDSASGRIVFETAPNNGGAPGTWSQLYSESWNTTAVPLGAVAFELKAGTWKAEANAPGSVKFDNFKAAKP
jgi:phosphatidylinositol-3-phosphatase